jgi:hypothetical protein
MLESSIIMFHSLNSAISEEEEVIYSQSSDSDHEEEHEEDAIDKRQTSIN